MKNTSGKKNIKTFLLNFSKGETISNLKIKKKKKKRTTILLNCIRTNKKKNTLKTRHRDASSIPRRMRRQR